MIVGLLYAFSMMAQADYPQVDTSLGHSESGLQGSPLGFGAGVTLGVPSGLSFSWRPSDAFVVQAGVDWFSQEQRMATHADLLINIVELESEDVDSGRFVAYAGTGFVVRWGWVRDVQLTDWNVGKPMMGIRVPAGVVFLPDERRLDVFLELAPSFYVIPSSNFDLSGYLGARIYFGGPETHL